MADPGQRKEGFNSDEIRAGVLAEINDLRATVQAFGWEAIKSGRVPSSGVNPEARLP